jgi:digalactosyldiacylglycerol synthase
MTSVADGAPAWPQVQQIKQLAKSVSTDLALRVPSAAASTLEDVKRNSESLMLTAQSQLQRQFQRLDAEDWSLLGRLSGPAAAQPRAGIRKSASDANLVRRRHITLARPPEATSKPSTPSKSSDGFVWLSAFNEKINQARDSSRPKFQLQFSRNGLEEHAKQLVHSASNMRLERVASQLIEKPREALVTAQQTFQNCQQNLQALNVTLQQSFSDRRASLGQRLQTLGEPGEPSSSGNRLATLLAYSQRQPTQSEDAMEDAAAVKSSSPFGSDGLPGYLQKLVQRGSLEVLGPDDEDATEDANAQGQTTDKSGRKSKPQGPFQLQAEKRRRQTQRRKGASSLREQGRQVTIVTTAALPWMTGTAVNPLLRAAYLARDGARSVNLMIPWLAKADQRRVFPNQLTFDSPEEQEQYVRRWVQQRTGFNADFNVTFYPGRYAPEKCSILPVGDPTAYIPDSAADVAILEEPEHLTWYHHGKRWTDKFSHVVGVVHTNYLDYARREEGGEMKEALLRGINAWVTRIHCHKVVKLSDAVQELPRQTTEFVHGVAESFLRVGEKKAKSSADGTERFSRGAYFLGKCVWAKGYTELLNLLSTAPPGVAVDCYGTGEDLDAVRTEATRRDLALHFHGARDHLDDRLHEYRVFINPSMSDVVATTTAEALAMGKWVICAEHPSNRFFAQFRNCLQYRTPEEFAKHVQHALSVEPSPMLPEEREKLTWEAATERFLDVTELSQRDLNPGSLTAIGDTLAWATHNTLCGVEPLRVVAGAGSKTRDAPANVVEYEPCTDDIGGLFDDRRRAIGAYKKT